MKIIYTLILFLLIIMLNINCPGKGEGGIFITVNNMTAEKVFVDVKRNNFKEFTYSVESNQNYIFSTGYNKNDETPKASEIIEYIIIRNNFNVKLMTLSDDNLDKALVYEKEDKYGVYFKIDVK
jgi:hypothetical protein